MKFITKVTVTGADDSVSPYQLLALANEFPFVEFGILLSRNAAGKSRFPSRMWLRTLVETCAGHGVQFSGHICGTWVKDILNGAWPYADLLSIHRGFMQSDMFQRWQINTHAEIHNIEHDLFSAILRKLEQSRHTVICQYDNVNNALVRHAAADGNKNIAALFDLSHGAGILPEEWPLPLDGIECGYAGGLSPENVADQIVKLKPLVNGTRIWIDAETHLRSPAAEHADPRHSTEDVFDLDKVRTFLEAARPWVIE